MSRISSLMAQRASRRTVVGGSAAVLAAGSMARFSTFAQDATPGAGGDAAEADLEIFSWWTTAGEAAGLQKLFDAFSAANPNVNVINAAVAGAAGSNAKAALQTRLTAGEPPDSWQSHTGAELRVNYVEPAFCDPITDLFTEMGYADVFPQGVLDQVTVDGEQYLVPVGVHRGNGMFYNTAVLEANGITVADDWTIEDFFTAADTLKAAGIAAIGLGSKDGFAPVQLFENTLLGALGADDYVKVWTGELGWDDERVTTAIETMARYFDYVNEDHAALTWDGAAEGVYNGTIAFTSMGDWLYGDAVTKKKEAGVGWVNHPSTGGSFVSIIDGFTMPKGAPDPVNAKNWLIAAGSAEAQTAFAPFKGAIPARSDADASGFNTYLQWSAASFGVDVVVPSLAHGSAASPQFALAATDAMVSFIVDKDVATFQDALVQAQADEQ